MTNKHCCRGLFGDSGPTANNEVDGHGTRDSEQTYKCCWPGSGGTTLGNTNRTAEPPNETECATVEQRNGSIVQEGTNAPDQQTEANSGHGTLCTEANHWHTEVVCVLALKRMMGAADPVHGVREPQGPTDTLGPDGAAHVHAWGYREHTQQVTNEVVRHGSPGTTVPT